MVQSFHEFVVHRSPRLSRTAYLLTGDHQLAEDLLQVALARTYRHWRRVADGDPEAYVRRVMYHQQVSWWRRRRLVARPPERSAGDGTEASVLRLGLAAALRKLTPRQRVVIVLRFYEDLTEARVAEVLGCSVGTVKRHGHDALRRLREIAPDLVDDTAEEADLQPIFARSVAFTPAGDRLAYQIGNTVWVTARDGTRLSSFPLPYESTLAGKGARTPDGRWLTLATVAWTAPNGTCAGWIR
ncbi:SigE family RNA polymerase sigma factor [Micromonospora craniellae]|uniref:SigE family RNA polymerase sigma factor n=1 Tax=Micromonospora craniellae TaxID=2294034 RepID=A0A372FT50_9ACTN|nr:SigE family RNA polymerase sigma factor [Micromonospora craniellae]RFS43689.1 SigE family RNA polymerase sigma factor [Micromonospora craniellae]